MSIIYSEGRGNIVLSKQSRKGTGEQIRIIRRMSYWYGYTQSLSTKGTSKHALKHEARLNNILKTSLSLKENITRPRYKDQMDNALYTENHKNLQILFVGEMQSYWWLKQVEHIATAEF